MVDVKTPRLSKAGNGMLGRSQDGHVESAGCGRRKRCVCSSVEPVAVSVREFRGSAKRAKDVPLGLRPHGISTRAGTLKTNQSLETRTSTKHHHPLDGGTGKSSSLHQSQFDLITASGVCISIATLTMTRMHCNHCNSLLLRCFSARPW